VTGAGEVVLRPLYGGEVVVDSPSEWDDYGVRDAPPPPELGRLVVELDGLAVGDVTWHPVWYGPNEGSRALSIGISLVAEARGRGVGTRAQRLLVEHLFATTSVERVEASTDVTNVAEQRALAKAGFTREGVLRSAQLRADGRHDLVAYSILRGDVGAAPAAR
jgi:RimJ/RimL family protein N-acetyltransferase